VGVVLKRDFRFCTNNKHLGKREVCGKQRGNCISQGEKRLFKEKRQQKEENGMFYN